MRRLVKSRFVSTVSTLAVGVAAATLTPALAQTGGSVAANESFSGSQDTIIVTAQRREQAIEEVPSSLLVLDDEELAIQRIESASAVITRAPNVSYIEQGSDLTLELSVRGVSNIGGIVNSVGIYLDEFNISPLDFSATISPELFDLEQAEVLRGPQGTLFGRNVVGGAISYTSKKPTDVFEASLTGEAANFDSSFFRGMVNIPIADTLAIRATGFYRNRGAFIEDIDPAGGTSNNDVESWGGRIAARFTPTDALTIDLAANYRDYEQGMDSKIGNGTMDPTYAIISSTVADTFVYDVFDIDGQIQALEGIAFPPGTANLFRAQAPLAPPSSITALDDGQGFFPENDDQVSLDAPFGRTNELQIYTGRLEYDFGDKIFIANLGYIDTTSTLTEDEDRTSIDFATLDAEEELESYSGEFRLQSAGGGNVDWVVGALFANDESRSLTQNNLELFGFLQTVTPFINQAPIAASLPGGVIIPPASSVAGLETALGLPAGALAMLNVGFASTNDTRVRELQSFAVFGDVTYQATDRLAVAAGLRFSRDTVSEEFSSPGGFNPLLAAGFEPPVALTGETDNDAITPRFAAVFDLTDDVNIYAQVARGTKPGGVNLGAAEIGAASGIVLAPDFEQESLWNYEAGFKGALFGNRVRFATSAFYTDWSNLQINAVTLTPTFEAIPSTQNIPDATSYGVEADFVAFVTDSVELFGAFGFNKTEAGDFDRAVDLLGAPQDVSGNALPLAPEVTARFGAQYESQPIVPVGLGTRASLLLRAEYIYTDEQFALIVDQEEAAEPFNQVPSWDSINLTAGLEHERFNLMAFVNNLEGDPYVVGIERGSITNGVQNAIVPRTYGVRLTLNF